VVALSPLSRGELPALLALSTPAVLRDVRLRPWAGAHDALAWLRRLDAEHTAYGVYGAGRGLVGAGVVRRVERLASFYYWIGEEHQGAGRGSAAAALLLDTALHAGAEEVWTCVLPHNFRSLRLLARLGFRPAARRADGLLYLRRGEGPPLPSSLARLIAPTPQE
jgi:RimJ/RimL family protein N-acetyltransferase